MGNLHFFHLLFLLQLYLPLLVLSEPYVFPAKFFINCGSDSSEIPLGARIFVGDKTPNSYSVVNGKSITSLQLSTESEDDLYRTARFSTDGPFSYELDITDQGLHVVRLHFFPFANLAAGAVFNVSASSKSLLSDFSVNNTSSFPVIKDFFVPITSSKFRIQFIPVNRASLAFVNAIEVFKVPNLEDNQTHLSSAGRNGFYQGLASQLLRTVHRIAFGSQPQSFNDSNVIASQWVVDDGYIVVGRNWATNCPYQLTLALKYDNLGPNDEDYNAASANFIPDRVYKTCKQVTLNGSQTSNSTTNITWHFGVRKNARHLVRVHFCDILGESPNLFTFNLFIYNNFSQPISPYDYTSSTAAPFYKDFVVDSGESDFVSVSVVPWVDGNSTRTRFAYLNGLEIMEFVTDPGLEIEISGSKGKKLVFIIIGSVVGFVVICTLLVAFLLFKKRRKAKPLEPMPSYGTLPFGGVSPYIGISSKSVNPPPVPMLNLKLKMPLAEILEATNNFTAKLLIGEGGFGKVYKGTLRNGQKVAVKRSESKHGQGLPEFQTEVIILSKIRHRHLVSLIGYCDEGSEMILVYEFMEKGTLRDHLYKLGGNPEGPALSLLTWRQRLEICIGAAKGLHYLHTGSDGGIIHRDVKSTNILLDEDYVAKVADFGLSKSGLLDPDEFSTGIKGSFGYLDPEYFRCLQFTEKSDVYSFGVVLLEVLCSRPAIINSHRKEEINLAEWGLIWLEKGELEKIVEPSMASEINPNSLRKFGEIVAKCLKPTGAERPAMLDICWDLEYTLQLQQTAVNREPHEDSAIDSSFNMTSRPFQRLPSNNIQTEKGNAGTENDDGSETTESSVFSQLRIDGGR